MTDTTMRRRLGRAVLAAALAAGALAATAGTGPASAALDADDLRLNEIQVVGSHNSYHLPASPEETAIRRQFIGSEDDLLQYGHAPLAEQFAEQKVRQIELDIFRDDEGGAYSDPVIRNAAGHGPYDPAMDAPGTKVLHVQDVDYRSTCLSLVACLEAVEGWSDANPDHLPIAILLELKDSPVPIDGPFVVPEPWDAAAMDALDEEILSVVPREEVITPDDVRGDAATLEDAVLETGWPTLGASRGKVMFLMDNGGGYRDDYVAGHPSLEGRVMFTSSEPGQDDAAFVKVNDSRTNVARIQGLVADGYVVRTRSDAETVEAREGDTSAREAAFASGAQWVSTDYPVPEYARPFGTGFVVEVPGGTIARCNPVTGPEGCVSSEIEPFPERAESPYVARLFEVFLGRPPSNVDQWFWARRIEMGASRSGVARAIARSPEGSRGPFLADLYLRLLDREIDAGGREFWGGRVRSGLVLDEVGSRLLGSPEAFAQAGADTTAWVELLYARVLGREADDGGRAHFVGLLEDGASRTTVARLVLGSAEARALRVGAVVSNLLERDATPAEVTELGGILRARRDIREVVVAVVATDELHG
ncbi:DUF4214 domain-containing protein [Iamia sp. SCSIO 61187]|uniref:Ca2+-dependent phosphoinositide-specific phospholipase C n=1 Tax=Iamia sp. SCSIO 61187 TaxID=2722752 RepID=UPI001C62F464|nr:Ca2+-dependent phosphoinositide-specific phospholipase C [Iamia sp. SCSIO 61187]QYG92629.1 DUF4214 domain-containing protein [Iamia sp. SCSIO 61187]